MQLRLADSTIDLTVPGKVMGIVNVTPDSFSDGGQFLETSSAVSHGCKLIAEGADVIDVGAESTRPGSDPVAAGEQIRRAVPVIEGVRAAEPGIPISIDTRSAEVAAAALDAGANIINDISALGDDPAMAGLAAERGVPVVLMHMKGSPGTMQDRPSYTDVVAEVQDFLIERIATARSAGIAADRIVIDPGIGFGKTTQHNLELIRRIDVLHELGQPILIGPSRKRFIGRTLGIGARGERLFGTAAVVAYAIDRGVQIVRVHDVGAIRQVVEMYRAIQRAGGPDGDAEVSREGRQ